MDIFRIICVLLFLHFSKAQYNPLKDPNICGRPQCEDGGKFKYLQNMEYSYKYSVHVSTLFVGTSKNESVVRVNAFFRMTFPTQCEGLLNFHDIKLEDENGNESPKSNLFAEVIEKNPLRFAFHDGYINEVCPEENEPSWALNFKKGLLSTFQNTMVRFDMDHNVLESDISGKCDTVYRLQGAKKTSLSIEKVRDLQTCTHRYTHHSILQTTPYEFRQNFQAWPVLNSTSVCEQSIDHHIYNSIICEEKHIFRPFSNQEAGATTITKQYITLISETKTHDMIGDSTDSQSPITSRSKLYFDHVPSSKPTHNELKMSRDYLKKLCQLGTDEIQREYTDAFTGFIHSAKALSHTALSQVLARADSICPTGRSHMLEALPYIGSTAAVQLMRDEMLIKNKISDEKIRSWMWSFAFIQRPSIEILEAMTSLLEQNVDETIFPLSISSLVHSFCKYSRDCTNAPVVKDLMQMIEDQIMKYKDHLDSRENIDKMLILLKAIGNAGVVSDEFSDTLLDIIDDPSILLVVRLAAIDAHRRLSCPKTREFFIELLKNQQQPSELRIAAYQQIMRCPNYLVINTIKNALDVEEVNQVGSFIWSHLHNLVKSANPAKIEVQSLLSDQLLGQKFNGGIRKFSRNYEYSVFFEDYNVGGSFESNVIFSTESYIPRSVLLNVTVDVCGESLNLFELSTRLEGFEHYTESLFGPRGPLSAEKVKDVVRTQVDKLANIRFPRQAPNDVLTEAELKNSIDKLPYKLDYNYNEPKLSFGMKIFGNDLQYLNYVGNDEVKNVANAMNPMTYVHKFLSGEEIKFKKAGIFLDASYSVPTYTGFPLNLKVHGSSGVDFRMVGSLQADNFLETKKLNLKGNVIPSVTVDVVGIMEVDAFFASTGIKLKTNLYSSSAVEVLLVIDGPKLVSLELSLPKEKTEIFSARSELAVVQNEVDKLQTGYDNFIDGSSCSWPVFNKAIGLEFCANYTLPNVTKVESAPSFLLSGPVRFNIALHKADPTAKKFVFEYKWENLKNASYVSFIFNTPNSAIKRLLGANITLADDSKNLTMIFQSDESIFRAHGLYKNNYDSIISNITLDINGNKHLDAQFEWKIKNETHGHSYTPKLYLAVNNEKVAELSGLLKVVTKKNISQYDIRLRFETKRLAAVLMGYVTDSDASTSTKLRLDYKFLESKLENLKVEGSLSNLSDRNRTHRRGEFKLETTAYPQYNFVSAFTFINHLGHVDCKVDINTSKNLTDPNHTLTIHTILLLNNSYEASKYSAQISIFKPVSRLDVGLQVLYEKVGFQHHGWVAVKYAPTKEIIGDIDVSFMRSPNFQADGKFNLSIPSFVPFVIEGSMAEKSHKEYVINLNACWFTGHTMRARALYNDNSTASRTSHYLKVHMKSPSDLAEHQETSHEVDINCRYHHDKKELRLDLQVSHNNDRYGMLLKHLEPSSSSISSYLKFRYKTQIYSIASTIETEYPNKQMLLDIHLDQIRDIHIALRGINGNVKKEFGVEVKWDANRDPGQKAVLSVEMHKPRPASISCGFVLSYPGRTVTGSLEMEAVVSELSDHDYKLSSRVMWSPQDEVSLYVVTGYGFQPGIHSKFLIDLYTPFDHWSRTALHLGFLVHQNLFHVNGSVLWESNQQIAIDIFGDYEITTESFRCTYNSSLTSTIKNVPSLSAFLKHKHNYTRVDTEINVKYNPEQVISIVSGWQLDRELKADTLSGTITIHSPFKGYGRGLLVSKMTFAHNRTLHGAAELDLDSKKYTLVIKGHLQKLTNNMLNFNITTPIQKYRLLIGRFGFSEELRHAVAEIRGPTDGIGLELLLDIHTTSNFDVKFHLATPFEQVKDVMLVGKLKKEEIDFRAGWNALVLGFAGVWRYNMLTDMEYSYKFFIPIEHFEENGVVVKIIYTDGLDVELTLQLSDKKVGIKALGKPNPVPLYREFGFKRPLLFEPIREDEDEDEDDEDDTEESEDLSIEDYESWSGLLELDTILYPTMKGIMDYEKIDTVQSISGSLTLEQGVIELRDDFQMLDVFTIRQRLVVTTPFKIAEEVTSNFDFRIAMGEKYLLDIDMNVLNYNVTQQGRLLLNYTIKGVDDDSPLKTHHAAIQLRTPIKNLALAQARLVLETQEGMYRVNVTAKTSRSEATFAGNLEMFKDYLEATGGLRLASDHLNIPMVTFLAKKDFSEIERRLELGFNILENNTWQKFDFETTWHVESSKYINMKLMLETPMESVSKLGCSILLSRTSNEIPTTSASVELNYNDNEVTVNAGRRGPHVTFELTTPLDEFRNITFTGQLEQGGATIAADAEALSYDLKGTLRSGPRVYKVHGEVIVLEPLPLKINVEMIPLHGGEPKSLQYVLARTPVGHAITARMDSGKRYLAVSGEASVRSKYDWDLGLHIDSSVTILKNLNFRSHLRTMEEDKIIFDIEMITPLKKLSRSNVTLDMTLSKESGSLKAAYGLDNSHGSVTCSWIYFFMKDMRINVIAEQHFREKDSRYVSLAGRYLNPSITGRKILIIDATQSMHMYGSIPDARSASFDIWRDYEDIRVSDVAFYLKLNHSRLVTGELTWRPEIKQDIKGLLRFSAVYVYDSLTESADYWRQYIRTETMDAIKDIWQDSEPYIQNYLDDLDGLKVLEEDFEEFRTFLNQSYYADDFYIQDIVGFFSYVIDELAIRSPIESLPDIINEIWEIMGESGQALRKSILWLIETAKASYKKAVELISKILHGDSMAEVTAILEGIVEKYDKFIKDLHVSFIKYMENLWVMTNEYIEYHWKKTIQSLEPSFIKFVHYVETIVWKVSREVLDFLYMRTNEIVESPYFAKFSNFTQDLDHIYRDLTGNDIFSNIYKYSKRIWNFLCDKYFRLVPFSKELQDVVDEIVQEFQQLKELPSIKYLLERIGEVNDRVTWFFDYFEVKAHLQHAFKLIRMKVTEITQTALQTENMYREAKTNFIFDPETGLMKLEQKLPMSWQAFNETPKFEEIPEFKAVSNLQSYFEASNTTFWTLYNEYKPYTEPSTWLPPFKAHAMIVGGRYFMTFDGRFTHFDGECSYLLAHDFLDGNFSVALGAPRGQDSSRRLYIRTGGKLVTIDISEKHIHVFTNGIRSTRLPVYLNDALLYRDADVFIIESELGYTIECNLQYDVCIIKLSGWYFGKTGGLLGTMNNEPSDDIITTQKIKPTNLQEWAKSWNLGVDQCAKPLSSAEKTSNEVIPEILELCDGFFKNKVSPFSSCFGVIDAEPFYKICVNQMRNESVGGFPKLAACSAAVAYQQMCTLQHTPLRIPDTCVQCELINGTKLREGARVQFEPHTAPRTTDVVFLVEAKSCNEDLPTKKSISALIQSVEKELQDLNITQNRYAVVVFGGIGAASVPRSVVINNEIFTKHTNLNMFLDSSVIGSKENLAKGDKEGSKDIFEAVAFASKLIFRPGASKTFVMLPCSTCNPKDMKLDYAAINSLLLESGIKLHMLINEEFSFDKVKANKVFYGIDQVTAYTKKDVNGLIGDKDLRDAVRLPKATLGYCSRLALGSNGSLFTGKKLESDKRNPVKKFVSVFAKRLASSAAPSTCQICECTARDHGTAYSHCYSCDYQTLPNQDMNFMDESSVLALLQDFSFDRDFDSDSSD